MAFVAYSCTVQRSVLVRQVTTQLHLHTQMTASGCSLPAACARRGLSVMKQHQLVTKALEEEIATWHGFVLETKPT